MSKVLIIGAGYVGLPIAMRAIEAGHSVVCVEASSDRISDLCRSVSYIEDVTDMQLKNAWETDRFGVLHVSAPAPVFDIALITVPTPVNASKQPDLTYIEAAAKYLGRGMRGGETVVLESTTYPGTTEDVVAGILREHGLTAGTDYHLGYSPERINPGDTVNTFETTPKIVSGVGAEALQIIQQFYGTLVETTVPVSSPRAAELAKVFENTFAQVNIALVNEMALVCSELGLDVDEVLDAAATKGHNIMRFRPGPGVGGHCIAVDPLYLTWMRRHHYGTPFEFAELADRVNGQMPAHVVNRARDLLAARGIVMWKAQILTLGLAYKPGVADTRESPAVEVVSRLRELGADVVSADPHVNGSADIDIATKTAETADLVIVLTDHAEFEYTAIWERASMILDARNVYAGKLGVHKL